MKPFIALVLVLALASQACSLDFNPPPISLTPQKIAATGTPVFIQPTLTSITPPTSVPPPPTATITNVPPTATALIPELTAAQLKNATLTVTGSDQQQRTISLKNGKYEQGTDPAQAGYVVVTLGEKISFGDLNGDGVTDAAITLAENFGGSGVFVSVLAIINKGGQPVASASMLIDDRPIINDLSIKNGEILVDATIHGINDPGCCPGLGSTSKYRLIENTLVLSRFTTKIPGNVDRIITIESPADGAQVNGPFIIKGTVTVSPFENNLTYSVFQQGVNDPIEKAGFIIKADTMGGPGTFELPLDFSKNSYKGPIRIEISDLSPANGSYLAMNTIYVIVK
jgi:hypothetical protein